MFAFFFCTYFFGLFVIDIKACTLITFITCGYNIIIIDITSSNIVLLKNCAFELSKINKFP